MEAVCRKDGRHREASHPGYSGRDAEDAGTVKLAARLVVGALLAVCAWHPASAQDARLTKVLAQLDAAAAKFSTASANFSWDQLTAVVNEHDVQRGTIAFRRGPKGTAMVVHVATEDGQPALEDVLYENGKVDLYQPKAGQETVMRAGEKRGEFESYATLGFGGSGRDLQAKWNVTYVGAEVVDGVSVAHLSLTPKASASNPLFTKVDIWIDPLTAISHKQVLRQADGDIRTALYTNIVENKTQDTEFKLNIPEGVKLVQK